jgi:hypothetical protein
VLLSPLHATVEAVDCKSAMVVRISKFDGKWDDAEWKGRPFPFSRGCSFYRLQESEQQQPQIV